MRFWKFVKLNKISFKLPELVLWLIYFEIHKKYVDYRTLNELRKQILLSIFVFFRMFLKRKFKSIPIKVELSIIKWAILLFHFENEQLHYYL